MKKNLGNPKRHYGIYFLAVCISVFAGSISFAKQRILDAKTQKMMTPDQALQDLINGNKRFYSHIKARRHSPLTLSQKASEYGQFPKAVILACMDSRSIPELVFDQSIADIFTLRVAGNIVNDAMIDSLEYATKHSGAKLIVIMGHTQCGAIKAVCDNVSNEYLEALIHAIEPAVTMIKVQSPNKQLDCSDDAVIKEIALQNVRNMKELVIKKSPVIRTLLAQGSIKMVGALHNLESGVVTFF
jgi:carbonic anhydrase